MLRIGREVAWLRLGSCTDQVISAAAATPDSAIRPRPTSSRTRRVSASRIDGGRWLTRGMTRSIAAMLVGALRLIQSFDQPMQRLGRRFGVRYQRKPDVAGAGIAAVVLRPRQIASGDHAHAGIAIKPHARRLVAATVGDVEPDAEAAGRTMVAIAVAKDLVGEIEL